MTEQERKVLDFMFDRLGPVSKQALFKELKLNIKSAKHQRKFEILVINKLCEEQGLINEVLPDSSYCLSPKGRAVMQDAR